MYVRKEVERAASRLFGTPGLPNLPPTMLVPALCAALVTLSPETTSKKTTRHHLRERGYQYTLEEYAQEYGKVYEAHELPVRKAALEVCSRTFVSSVRCACW